MNQTGSRIEVRTQARRWLAVAGAGAFAPFDVRFMVVGDYVQAGVGALVLGLLIWRATQRDESKLTPLLLGAVFFPSSVLAVCMATADGRADGALWAFPLVCTPAFVLPTRYAPIISGLTIALVTPIAWTSVSPAFATRMGVTLTIVALIAAISMHLVDRHARELQRLAVTDPLTGLLNRAELLPALEQGLTHTGATLVSVDIDHFKRINDEFGHLDGDEVISGVAEVVREMCGERATVFRVGGEEFLAVLSDTTLAEAQWLGEAIVGNVRSGPIAGHRCTVSVGIAQAIPGDDIRTWMRRVDRCLYTAKRLGRDRVATVDDVPTAAPPSVPTIAPVIPTALAPNTPGRSVPIVIRTP